MHWQKKWVRIYWCIGQNFTKSHLYHLDYLMFMEQDQEHQQSISCADFEEDVIVGEQMSLFFFSEPHSSTKGRTASFSLEFLHSLGILRRLFSSGYSSIRTTADGSYSLQKICSVVLTECTKDYCHFLLLCFVSDISTGRRWVVLAQTSQVA